MQNTLIVFGHCALRRYTKCHVQFRYEYHLRLFAEVSTILRSDMAHSCHSVKQLRLRSTNDSQAILVFKREPARALKTVSDLQAESHTFAIQIPSMASRINSLRQESASKSADHQPIQDTLRRPRVYPLHNKKGAPLKVSCLASLASLTLRKVF